MTVTIYHNADCGTSRNTLALNRNAGIEPVVINYLTTPPDRTTLVNLIARSGLAVRDVVRQKEKAFVAMQLDTEGTTDEQLIEAMLAHPVSLNHPLVAIGEHTSRCCED